MARVPDTMPVILGVGHATRRPADLGDTREPAAVIGEAVAAAAADAGMAPGGPAGVDRLDVVRLLSWRYGDPCGAVAAAAGLDGVSGDYSPMGGDQPTRLLAAAARTVASGRAGVVVVAGGEALRSRRIWQAAGEVPPWTPPADPPGRTDPLVGLGGGAAEHGLTRPAEVYPLVENAARAATGIGLAAAQARSGRLWAGLSAVAARTPGAWSRQALTAEEIVTSGPGNRPIAHPYTKRMCANPTVDQAAAVVVGSRAVARRLGLGADHLVHIWTEAGAADTTEILGRPTFASSVPMARVLGDALDAAGLGAGDIDLWELYSCFPIVPKLAMDALGLDDARVVTVAGGLSFYGGPLNAYMLAAAVNMVRALRRGEGANGVLYGNGEYVTKHHALVVGREPGPYGGLVPPDDRDARQEDLDRRPAPALDPAPEGRATVETSTVVHDRDGAPARGIVVGRTAAGRRFVANTPADADHFGALADPDGEPVGRPGVVRRGPDGNRFTLS